MLISALAIAAGVAQADTQSTPQKAPASHHTSSKHKKSRKTARKRGQQKIDAQRATQIQQALIREHYLTGKPTGVWDNATQTAMQKFQADNGWQAKTTPDARALIKLGLGPDHDHLLNPESAMTSQPATPKSGASPTADPSTLSRPQK